VSDYIGPVNEVPYEDACNHAMLRCPCHERSTDGDEDDDDNDLDFDERFWTAPDPVKCCLCRKYIPLIQAKRMPRLHGGWTGWFCGWKHVIEANERAGGNSIGRSSQIEEMMDAEAQLLAKKRRRCTRKSHADNAGPTASNAATATTHASSPTH
jgi:hypothetical protein